MLEIWLPSIYRARSTPPPEERDRQVDDGAGFRDDHELRPAAPRITAASVPDEMTPLPHEDVVPIDELLGRERPDRPEPRHGALRRLVTLIAVAAIVVAVIILIVALGAGVADVSSSQPGS